MIIGVDATCWANVRGYGRFARELMRAMTRRAPADQFVCFGDRSAFAAYPDPLPNVRLVEVALGASPTVAASADSSRSPLDMLRLSRAVARERLDVFFSPSVYTYFPVPPRLPVLLTIHDTIPERFPGLTLPSARARFFWATKVRVALMQARLVLTVSDYSARSIATILGVAPARIRVCVEAPASVYRPCDADAIRTAARAAGLPDDVEWFVYVGGFNPHKRVDLILRAHAALARTAARPPHLLLVGSRSADVFHKTTDQLDDIVKEVGTGPLVHWTGYLDDETLRPLLAGSVALLLPSEAEGFGLPAVEAAATGAPVIATRESPLPELLAGGGLFVDPGDLTGLQDAMRRLLDEPATRRDLGRIALARAAAMSWDTGADQVLRAIRECVTA